MLYVPFELFVSLSLKSPKGERIINKIFIHNTESNSIFSISVESTFTEVKRCKARLPYFYPYSPNFGILVVISRNAGLLKHITVLNLKTCLYKNSDRLKLSCSKRNWLIELTGEHLTCDHAFMPYISITVFTRIREKS